MKTRVPRIGWLVLCVSFGLISTANSGDGNSTTEGASGGDLNNVERKKRHLVYRFHELTVKGASRCPIEDYPGYHSALSKFQSTFPDFVALIDASPHRAYADKMMQQEESSEFAKREAIESRDSACKFYEEFLHLHANDEKGKKTIREEVIEVLKR